jgi:hypothetical protein
MLDVIERTRAFVIGQLAADPDGVIASTNFMEELSAGTVHRRTLVSVRSVSGYGMQYGTCRRNRKVVGMLQKDGRGIDGTPQIVDWLRRIADRQQLSPKVVDVLHEELVKPAGEFDFHQLTPSPSLSGTSMVFQHRSARSFRLGQSGMPMSSRQ